MSNKHDDENYQIANIPDSIGDVFAKAGDIIEEIKEFDIDAEDILKAAMKFPMAKVNREQFLNKELSRYYSPKVVATAIEHNPAYAGIEKWSVDKIAKEVINYETNKVSTISFAAGIPGGLAMIGTVPADLAQYFGFMIRTMQKLAYLYGFPEFEFDEEEVSDDAMNDMLIFMGVMFGAEGASEAITKIAEAAAQKTAKTLAQKALTKGTIYPIVKKIAQALGVRMTKQIFADGISKIIPVIGGVVSGGLTYATFKPCSIRLKKSLSSQNLCDPEFYKRIAAEEGNEASE